MATAWIATTAVFVVFVFVVVVDDGTVPFYVSVWIGSTPPLNDSMENSNVRR